MYTRNGSKTGADETVELCHQAAETAGHRIRAEVCQADVGLDADRHKLVDFTRETFGRLDLLVNLF